VTPTARTQTLNPCTLGGTQAREEDHEPDHGYSRSGLLATPRTDTARQRRICGQTARFQGRSVAARGSPHQPAHPKLRESALLSVEGPLTGSAAMPTRECRDDRQAGGDKAHR